MDEGSLKTDEKSEKSKPDLVIKDNYTFLGFMLKREENIFDKKEKIRNFEDLSQKIEDKSNLSN